MNYSYLQQFGWISQEKDWVKEIDIDESTLYKHLQEVKNRQTDLWSWTSEFFCREWGK